MTSGLLLQRTGLSTTSNGCQRRRSCACSARQRPSMARGRLMVHSMMGTTTTNPALTFGLGKAQDAMYEQQRGREPTELMTLDGAVQKTAILLGVAVLSASYTWMQVFSGVAATAMMALNMGQMAGFVALGSSLATMFKPQWAPYSGLLFAAAEGVTLGAFSSIMELRYPGIVMSAVMLVFGTAATLLAAYQTRLISVTDNFRNGVMMVTGGYMFVLLGSMLLRFLGMNLPAVGSGGIVGIGISLVAAALASANLLLDFDMIKRCARMGLPKWMEWYSAFSLMVTLVWLFTEALRLLRMLSSSRDN